MIRYCPAASARFDKKNKCSIMLAATQGGRMLYRILEVGASIDLVSPLLALLQNALNGPSHTFLVPDDCGWSGRQIERLLKQHGVKLWGRMIVRRTIIFTVRIAQARWAEQLLRQESIPVVSPPVQVPARRSGSTYHRPSHSLLDRLDSSFDKVAQVLTRWL
jgi:hypothetical protein